MLRILVALEDGELENLLITPLLLRKLNLCYLLERQVLQQM
ncbi:hypothetical protein E2C01_074316 [Portunus trituberculatus]|uniref:Uncharacterized protein n=1 Tax=Portunus trituberculatus TaxID=210409 RepID=A0A5B7I5D3_PORTR|nr:hypothetical protein [Portunus trituberculatus]